MFPDSASVSRAVHAPMQLSNGALALAHLWWEPDVQLAGRGTVKVGFPDVNE